MVSNQLVLGTLLVGIFFNTYLYGLVTYQFAAYHVSKFNDPLWIRVFVGILFALDTFHTAAVIYMAWEYCVTNYNNPDILAVALWPYTFTPIGTAMAAVITHIFLGYRIYRLTERLWIFVIVLFVAAATFALGVACGTKAWMIRTLADLPVLNGLVITWLVMQVAIDAFITITLVFVLWRAKTNFRATDTVINRLIRGAIQTGLFASIFSLGDMLAFALAPETNFYGMFAIPLGRIYTNTLMDTLLMREGLRGILSKSADGSLEPSSSIWGTNHSQAGNFSRISFNKSHLRTHGAVDVTGSQFDASPAVVTTDAYRDNDGDSKYQAPTEADSQDRHGDIKVVPA
ncbi:hypothetical protein ONZ45_g4950 [Pleurotus djamor]|nr:hypothetical protein ONZ45_g4950 [Pleurotus djamor]